MKSYVEWLEKATETKIFDAMKEFAKHLREEGDCEKAIALFKELAETFSDDVRACSRRCQERQ